MDPATFQWCTYRDKVASSNGPSVICPVYPSLQAFVNHRYVVIRRPASHCDDPTTFLIKVRRPCPGAPRQRHSQTQTSTVFGGIEYFIVYGCIYKCIQINSDFYRVVQLGAFSNWNGYIKIVLNDSYIIIMYINRYKYSYIYK